MRLGARIASIYISAIASVIGLAAAPTPTMAQGFFESLFGGGNTGPQRMPGPRQALPPPLPSQYGYRTPVFTPYRPPTDRDYDDAPQSRSGQFRTMCVRMCDGYYWPISNATSRSGFYRDANACRASCGEEARLFYVPSHQPDVTDMVDLSGRAYSKLPNAFRYRKALSESCKCKPDPWAQSELDRHRRYALNETAEDRLRKERLTAQPADPAGAEPSQRRVAETARAPEPQGPTDPDDNSTLPVEQPPPIESPRPKARRADPRLDGRPVVPTPRGPTKAPTAVRPAPQPTSLFPFGGPGSGAKSRWPGD